MTKTGMVIAFSGASGAGTGELSQRVADLLGWRRVRFSDVIRRRAHTLGRDTLNLRVLQEVGQALVQDELEQFVDEVLTLAGWERGGDLILDGLRHAEVCVELRRRLGESAHLYVIHIDLEPEARAARTQELFGFDREAADRHDQHVSEAQLAVVLPNYADLRLDGGGPVNDLVQFVLHRFGRPEAATDPEDRGEDVGQLEPLLIRASSKHFGALANLAGQLLSDSKDFSGALSPGLRAPLADLVREMNCYYSNLIEGHRTLPTNIERALKADFATDPETRDLQLEAVAHIEVQAWIDAGALRASPASDRAIREIHRRFCERLPDRLLWLKNPHTGEKWRVVSGELRRHDVEVGRHLPPSPGAIPRFLRRFEETYTRLTGPVDAILGAAAAHHRLLWIHPFSDGNGRVARLMSHAMLLQALETHSVWSVARGLGRQRVRYKQELQAADLRQRNSLDGRGPLSEETLTDFIRFFLEVCLDQVRFMAGLMDVARLRPRLSAWVAAEAEAGRLPSTTTALFSVLLAEPGLRRADALQILAVSPDRAEAAMRHLFAEGVLADAGESRVRIAFPAKLAPVFVPGLFP